MKLMLLAAGLGTRLRPVTDTYAKPAVPFMNIPLLYYPFSLLEPAGIDALIVNTHHKAEQVETLAKNIPGFSGQVQVTFEAGKPLGSGGGVWHARQHLSSEADFFVANGDEVIFPSRPQVASDLLRTHQTAGALATLYVTKHPDVGSRFGGVWTSAEGLVYGFGKQKPEGIPNTATGYHYVGICVLSGRIFKYLPEGESNLLYDALMAGIRNGERVQIYEDNCVWFETGSITDFLEATQAVMSMQKRSAEIWFYQQMSERFAKETSKVEFTPGSGPALCGPNVRTSTPVDVRGFAVIGDGAVLGKECVLENCVILPGAKVADGSHLINTVFV